MKKDLREKLQQELNKEIKEESQVIYILSRIRKLLEVNKDRYRNKYKKLKFYCDWALHAEIDKGTKAFQGELEKFIQGDQAAGAPIFTFEYFETEFLNFLKEKEISSTNYQVPENKINFRKLMAQIYSDTPLIVTFTKKFMITTNEGVFTPIDNGANMEIGYTIQPLE